MEEKRVFAVQVPCLRSACLTVPHVRKAPMPVMMKAVSSVFCVLQAGTALKGGVGHAVKGSTLRPAARHAFLSRAQRHYP